VSDIFVSAGTSVEHARTIADVLVWANLRGVDSHGVSRVPRYLELFNKGEAKSQPDLTVDQVRAAVAIVDADSAPGPVALSLAMDQAVSMAKSTGIAWVSVRGTVHTGAIGYYTSRAADYGMAALGIVAGMPNMGYPNVSGAAVATSPLSVALPAGSHPTVLLDMATAVIALGRIAQYKAAGTPLPEGAAMTKDGRPTIDAEEAAIPMPMAGAKGAGMSLVFELLASGLTANPIVSRFHSDDPDGRRHRQNAALMAIDVSAFLPVEQFRASVDHTLEAIKSLPKADDSQPLLYPGERGARTYTERISQGIPVPTPLLDKLRALGASKAGRH
jgi:LDH2 family malate/lactate/ureidoglycolate dehydrogenase